MLIIALLLLIPAAIGFLCTKVNYDLFTYLPDELESVQGEQILDETFHNAGMSIVITDGMTPRETKKLKEKIGEVPGVSQTLWVCNDTAGDLSGSDPECLFQRRRGKDHAAGTIRNGRIL